MLFLGQTQSIMFVEKSIFNFKTFIKLRKVYSKIYKRPFSNFLSEDLHTDFSITNVKKSLKSNKLTFEDGFVNIVTECPFCEVDTNENKNRVYINKTTGNGNGNGSINIFILVLIMFVFIFQVYLYVRNASTRTNGIFWRGFQRSRSLRSLKLICRMLEVKFVIVEREGSRSGII